MKKQMQPSLIKKLPAKNISSESVTQSLKNRNVSRKKNQQKQLCYPNVSSDSSNTITPRNGCKTCPDTIDRPEKTSNYECRKPSSKKVKIKLPTASDIKPMQRGGRNVAVSTPVCRKSPVCLNSSSNAELHHANMSPHLTNKNYINKEDVEKLLSEKITLENMLRSIESDKKGIESKYQLLWNEEMKTNTDCPTKLVSSKNGDVNEIYENVTAKQINSSPYSEDKELLSHKKNPSTVELSQLVGRIANNLSISRNSTKSLSESEFSQHSIKVPPKVSILTDSVQNVLIPSAVSSLYSAAEEDTSNPEMTFHNKQENFPDSSLKDQFKQFHKEKIHKHSPLNAQMTTLSYLLKELRTLLGDKVELEVDRLLCEIYHIVEMLPFLSQSIEHTEDQNNSLQSLKKDNKELQRKLFIENEKLHNSQIGFSKALKEKELFIERLGKKIENYEKSKNSISKEIEEVHQVTESLRQENLTLINLVKAKKQKHKEVKEALIAEKNSIHADLQYQKNLVNELTMERKAHEKEKRIHEISLQQRDVEIKRLNQLNSDLQSSVSTLLSDINIERKKHESNVLKSDIRKNTIPPILNLENSIVENLSYLDSTLKEQSSIKTDSRVDQLLEPSSLQDTLLSLTKNSSISTLATLDNSEFRKGLDQLDHEIKRIQHSLKKK